MQTKLDEAKAELLERAARVAENSPVGGHLPTGTERRASIPDQDTVLALPPALLPAHRAGGPRRPRPGRRLRRRALPLPAGREPPAGHGQRAGAHPDRRGERLDLQPLRRRGRHRRHALPGRLGHQRAVPAGPRHPPRRSTRRSSSAATSPASCIEVLRPRRADRRRRCRTTRSSSPGSTSRSTARPTAPTSSRSTADLLRVLTDVREAVEDWAKMRDAALRIADELPDEPTAADLRDAGGRGGPRAAALARRRPLHLPRLPRVRAATATATTAAPPCPAPASASCAPTRSTARTTATRSARPSSGCPPTPAPRPASTSC